MCTATIRPPGAEKFLERFFRQDFSEQRYGNRTDKSKNLGQKNQQKGVNSLLLIWFLGDVCGDDCLNGGPLSRRLCLIGNILDESAAQGDELSALQCVDVAANGDGVGSQRPASALCSGTNLKIGRAHV